MSIEQTLASMAHRQLTQNMPSLASNLLGFELITTNEDNTLALGVNVAIIGDTYVYIPTILKNGRIAPVDLMYVPELDQFLPCKDAWVTYLQSKKTDLVAALSKKKNKIKGGAGDVDLTMPFESITKVASATGDRGLLLDHASKAMVDSLTNAPDSFHIPSIPEMLDHVATNGLRKLASYIASIDGHDALAEFYSNEDIKNIINKVNKRIEEAETPVNVVEGEVKILTSASSEAKILPNDDKVKILRDGAIIKDTRGLVPSTVYKTKNNSEWVTPAHDGLYELLKADGSTLTAYVINANNAEGVVSTKKDGGLPSFYVIPLDDGQKRIAYKVEKKRILGQSYPNMDKFTLKGNNITSIPRGDVLVIDGAGDVYPLYIANTPSVVKGADETFLYSTISTDFTGANKVSNMTTHQLGAVGATNKVKSSNYDCGRSLECIIVGKAGSRTRVTNNNLRVGSDASYVTVSHFNEDKPLAVKALADDSTFLRALEDREGNITLSMFKSDDGKIVVDSDLVKTASFNPIEVEKELVERLVLTPNDAHALVKQASFAPTNYLVKIAAESELMIRATDMMPEDMSTDSLVLTPTEMSDDDKKVLDAAVNSGVKEVFDVSILRILAEEDAPDQIINEWIPALFTAMDKLGRILYLCRAGESMQDAYGNSRVDDVERKLRKQFNELGDIILTMLKGRVSSIDDLLNGDL